MVKKTPKPTKGTADTAKKEDNGDNLKDPLFTPPEKLVESEPVEDVTPGDAVKATATKKNSWWNNLLTDIKGMSLKKKLLIFIPIGIFLIGGSTAAFLLIHQKSVPASKPVAKIQKKEEPPKPTTVAGKLTGNQISPELNQRSATGVMIENSV